MRSVLEHRLRTIGSMDLANYTNETGGGCARLATRSQQRIRLTELHWWDATLVRIHLRGKVTARCSEH